MWANLPLAVALILALVLSVAMGVFWRYALGASSALKFDPRNSIVGALRWAGVLPWYGAALFVAVEALTLSMARDGLLLSVLMVTAPLDVIRHWQAGA